MSRIFYAPVTIADAGTDADQNLFELVAGATNKCILHGFELTSNTTAAAALKLELKRISAAGTGGTAVTKEDSDENTDLTAESAFTTDAETPGTPIATLASFYWEQLGPLTFMPTPEMRPVCAESNGFALTLSTSAANAAIGGYVVWEEV